MVRDRLEKNGDSRAASGMMILPVRAVAERHALSIFWSKMPVRCGYNGARLRASLARGVRLWGGETVDSWPMEENRGWLAGTRHTAVEVVL